MELELEEELLLLLLLLLLLRVVVALVLMSDMLACDVFDVTIKSPENFSCPLALPGSTNNIGGPRSRRIVKHSKTRGASSLGSTSKLIKASRVPVAPNTPFIKTTIIS